MKIKFSHKYPKLHGQRTARLFAVEVRDLDDLHKDFVEYDTFYEYGPMGRRHYDLPKGSLLVLVFIGDKLIPFTTVRRSTPEKDRYYREAIGKTFDVVIEVAA
jgi:hypothetical protein